MSYRYRSCLFLYNEVMKVLDQDDVIMESTNDNDSFGDYVDSFSKDLNKKISLRLMKLENDTKNFLNLLNETYTLNTEQKRKLSALYKKYDTLYKKVKNIKTEEQLKTVDDEQDSLHENAKNLWNELRKK